MSGREPSKRKPVKSSKKGANKEKLDKISEKLIKSIRFEVEVQKNIAQTVVDQHKKRLKNLQKFLDEPRLGFVDTF